MSDIFCVESESPFSAAQFEAARFLIARLRAEAANEKFDADALGMKFTPLGDYPAASVDDGTVISMTDFIRASLLILWSLVLDTSENSGLPPGQIIAEMGLSLAEHHPA